MEFFSVGTARGRGLIYNIFAVFTGMGYVLLAILELNFLIVASIFFGSHPKLHSFCSNVQRACRV